MRCGIGSKGRQTYYRCRSRDYSVRCPQPSVPTGILDEQVLDFLHHLALPAPMSNRVIASINNTLMQQQAMRRLEQIRDLVSSIVPANADALILDGDKYLRQYQALREAVGELSPMPADGWDQAAEMYHGFSKQWKKLDGDPVGQRNLITLIVDRVFVRDENAVRIRFHTGDEWTL